MNKIKKQKRGFTLGEVLLCVVIVGLVMALASHAIRIVKTSYASLTYFTFKNLKDMVGVIYSDQTAYTEAQTDSNGNIIHNFFDYRGQQITNSSAYGSDDDSEKAKTRVTTKYNDSGGRVGGFEQLGDGKGRKIASPVTNCTYDETINGIKMYSILSVLRNDKEYHSVQDGTSGSDSTYASIAGDTYSESGATIRNSRKCTSRTAGTDNNPVLFCQALAGVINISGESRCSYNDLFDSTYVSAANAPFITSIPANKKPTFITTNGQAFYISKWARNTNISDKYGYRVIAVDLNGKSGPNKIDVGSASYTNSPPDIIQFVVLDNGQVYPVGLAANNMEIGGKKINYITAQIKGYYFSNSSTRDEVNIPDECLKLKLQYKKTAEFDSATNSTSYKYEVTNNDSEKLKACDFGRVSIQKAVSGAGATNSTTFLPYREAYCMVNKAYGVEFLNYCNSYNQTPLCPPSSNTSMFDECRIVTVKPMFRFNFK